jgi:hypothetical protein
MATELFHLPDLPNVGYSTLREKRLSDEIMLFMRDVERDRLRLLTIVVDGPDKWRTVARRIWRGLGIETDALDEIYRYFVLQAARPAQQRELLDARRQPATWRAIVKGLMPDIEAQQEQMRLMAKWR